jgi:hemerythrin-like domain-containing protein
MNATDLLVDEHRVIEQVLNCLEKVIEQAIATWRLEEEPAREAIDFFLVFADRCHRKKEEAHLFPLMQTREIGGGSGPVSVMRTEHELGRLHLDGTHGAIERASNGDASALQWFVQHGQNYIRLVREHIRKEEQSLFPSANRAMKESDHQTLLAAFEKLDAKEMRRGTHEKYLALANRLADRFGVTRADNGRHTVSRN